MKQGHCILELRINFFGYYLHEEKVENKAMARIESIQKFMNQDHTTGERNLNKTTSKWRDRFDTGTKSSKSRSRLNAPWKYACMNNLAKWHMYMSSTEEVEQKGHLNRISEIPWICVEVEQTS